MKDEGSPLRMVLDSNFDMISVMTTPRTIAHITAAAAAIDLKGPAFAAINMEERAINMGNRPLHGTKLFVMVAISLSRGESIILHAITPAALHPKPIHMVNACFPCAHALLKKLSKLNATLGRYPKSSNSVKSGKNIAIGGNITDITQANVLYTPSTRMSYKNTGTPADRSNIDRRSSNQKSPFANSSDG